MKAAEYKRKITYMSATFLVLQGVGNLILTRWCHQQWANKGWIKVQPAEDKVQPFPSAGDQGEADKEEEEEDKEEEMMPAVVAEETTNQDDEATTEEATNNQESFIASSQATNTRQLHYALR